MERRTSGELRYENVALAMETILGSTVDEVAQQHQVIKRKRKPGQSLLRMIVFMLLKKPNATFEDMYKPLAY